MSKRKSAWNELDWKAMKVSEDDLGNFQEDCVFFGLEELDSSAFKLSKTDTSYVVHNLSKDKDTTSTDGTTESKKKKQKKTKKKEGEEKSVRNTEEGGGGKAGKDKIKKSKTSDNKEEIVLKKVKKGKGKGKGDENETAVEPALSFKEKDAVLRKEREKLKDECLPWGQQDKAVQNTISLHSTLTTTLQQCGFTDPTPIQSRAIPIILEKGGDVVGAAETGSGKTLAFCLPILNNLLQNWDVYHDEVFNKDKKCPFALIIVPTRELAMQMATVLKSLCAHFRDIYKVEIVPIVGGMSEQKQRRLLDGKKPAHIVIATPGRLCELMEDPSLPVFTDMSLIHYLVVDEADRIVEEGHFSELSRLFSRITDHENRALEQSNGHANESSGMKKTSTSQMMENKDAWKRGEDYGEDEDMDAFDDYDEGGDDVLGLDFKIPEFESMPTEAEIEEARRQQAAIPIDEMDDSDYEEGDEDEVYRGNYKRLHHADEDIEMGEDGVQEEEEVSMYSKCRRTLLFSATALVASYKDQSLKGQKKAKKQGRLPGLDLVIANRLPTHIHELLCLIAVGPCVDVVDATAGADSKEKKEDVEKNKEKSKVSKSEIIESKDQKLSLPSTLSHYQIEVSTEEKDVHAYYYVEKHQHERILIFANSIKTARRVDGLLRALNVNCRVIHAQLQQKQRLKALEAFQASTSGVLVATDVAARGLDIPNINAVLHYDIARSFQLYVHRSGRTARASKKGTSVSLVSPEDAHHHLIICADLYKVADVNSNAAANNEIKSTANRKMMPSLVVDLASLPLLRKRCTVAKAIFLQNTVSGKKAKDKSWVEQTAEAAGLMVDESMYEFDQQEQPELNDTAMKKGGKHKRKQNMLHSKKELKKNRNELKHLLQTPIESTAINNGKGAKRKGFFVYNPTL